MTYNQQASYTSVSTNAGLWQDGRDDAVGFDPFNSSLSLSSADELTSADSTLDVSFNDDQVISLGQISTTTTASSSASSYSVVDFNITLSEDATVSITGTMSSTLHASTEIIVYDSGNNWKIYASSLLSDSHNNLPVNESVELSAGNYRVFFRSFDENYSNNQTYSAGFDLTMTVVPEPATMMIMAAGMLGLLRKRS
ncbi:PEP-CTERM sorting domain-containing protein [Limihaloglobus sulfuriphilus]|nr:PEP-CTERM sorting domain-containing protein [Limihaloglobus sulfuriphilus]